MCLKAIYLLQVAELIFNTLPLSPYSKFGTIIHCFNAFVRYCVSNRDKTTMFGLTLTYRTI